MQALCQPDLEAFRDCATEVKGLMRDFKDSPPWKALAVADLAFQRQAMTSYLCASLELTRAVCM